MNDAELMISGGLLKKSVENAKDTERIIKGYCSVPQVDLENEIISTNAYDSAIKTVRDRVNKGRPLPMFIEHRRKELSLPVGAVVDAGKDDKGLWFKGKIAKGAIGDSVWDLIKQNILYSVSMGGEALRKHRKFDNTINKDVTVIDDLVFRELSLTGLPVNEEAVFSIAKSFSSKKEKEKFSKEVVKSLKKLNAAIDFEKSISDLEKAAEGMDEGGNENLSEDQIKRIEESMTTLARLLGIKTSFSAEGIEGTQQPGEMGEQQTTDDLTEEMTEEQPTEELTDETTEALVDEGTQKPTIPQKKGNLKNNKPVQETKEAEETETLEQTPEETSELTEEGQEPLEEETDEMKVQKKDQKKKKKFVKQENTEMASPDKALESTDLTEDAPASTDEKLDKIIELLKRGGEKSLDIIKCVGCGSNYEKSDYDVNFCPKCGEDLAKCEGCKNEDEDEDEDFEKSDDDDEDDDEVGEDEEALFCKSCESVFGKADEYDMCFCPKCGGGLTKSGDSVAIAANPQGAKTKWEAKKEAAEGNAVADSVAIASNPQGAKTKWTKKSAKKSEIEKNLDVKSPAQEGTGESVAAFGDGSFQEPNKKVRTDKEDSTLHDFKGSEYQDFSGAPKEGIFDTYETDRKGIGKSLEDRLDSIEKALGNISSESSGRKSRVPNEKVEKSDTTSEVDSNRFLAQVFLGKIK